jgi:hypothetical protein
MTKVGVALVQFAHEPCIVCGAPSVKVAPWLPSRDELRSMKFPEGESKTIVYTTCLKHNEYDHKTGLVKKFMVEEYASGRVVGLVVDHGHWPTPYSAD